jgi:predicted outer membrane repeat protein
MNRKALAFGLAMSVAGCVLCFTLALLERGTHAVAPITIYVAPGADCGAMVPCYAHPQDAVDAAEYGDVIKLAASPYTGVSARGDVTQVLYISKSLTIQGGYTITNWSDPDPSANPTLLDAQGQGRGVYITGDISATIEGLRITGGNATGLGGGPLRIDAGGGAYIQAVTVTIRDGQVLHNSAARGGGLYLSHSVATLDGNTFFSNSAEGNGGGLYMNRSVATLSANTLISNTAGGDGGALCLNSSDATLSGDTLFSNTATGYGGAMHLWSSDATLNNSALITNTAYCGGGMYLRQSAATLSGSTIDSNTAVFRGAGLYVHVNSQATLSGSSLGSNTANYGGGMYVYESTATLSGNTIVSNVATEGSGMVLYQSDATLTNNLVADNQSSGAGGGLYSKGSSSRLIHNTIARNGSGIYATSGVDHSTVALTNTILVSHTVGITVTAGNTATLDATVWGTGDWANITDWGGAGRCMTGTRNTWGDPSFVVPEAGDYHIGSESPAIDAGLDAGVTIDFDGDPRPVGVGFDIGADEYFVIADQVYLPVTLRSFPP